MAYSYDCTLTEDHIVASANFATPSPATVVLPCVASADLGDDPYRLRQPRVLRNARVLGISGIVATAGTGLIQIGDGTDVDRYGTISVVGDTVGNSIVATIELTEEGCHMGVADVNPTTTAFTLTLSGTALVVTNLKIIFGHW